MFSIYVILLKVTAENIIIFYLLAYIILKINFLGRLLTQPVLPAYQLCQGTTGIDPPNPEDATLKTN